MNSTLLAHKKVEVLFLVIATAFFVIAGVAAESAAAESIDAAHIRQGLFATCFVNEKEGWAVGDLGRIFHTVDGAKNWEVQSAGTKRPFVAVACLDSNTAWIAGQAGDIAS